MYKNEQRIKNEEQEKIILLILWNKLFLLNEQCSKNLKLHKKFNKFICLSCHFVANIRYKSLNC